MSEENVEVIRRGYDAFSRADFDAMLESLDPEIEIHPETAAPGLGVFHGHDGYMKFLRQWLEPWDEYRIEPERFVAAGDRVVAFTRHIGRRKDVRVEVEQDVTGVWTMREGRATRVDFFFDRQMALEAAGLSE